MPVRSLVVALALVAPIAAGAVTAAPALAADTGVRAFGAAADLGSPGTVNRGLVAMAADPDGDGYWLVAGDGGVFGYRAGFYGSTGGLPLVSPVVDMARTPTGRGYWLVAGDGGVFAFGDAAFHGSMGGRPLNRPVVAIAASPGGRGYWLVAGDGGVFAFGDAAFHGSLPGSAVRATAVDLVPRPQGDGYWIVDDRGGVYAFGQAPFAGSLPGQGIRPAGPVVGAAATPSGAGYWLATTDGGVFTFGDAGFFGAGALPPGQRAVGFAARPDGAGYWLATTTGMVPAVPGDTGEAVLALQRRLAELGYWLPTPDGRYGPLTAQAVMAFQKYEGLPRTGVADQPTVDALATARPPQARTTSGDIIEIDKPRQLLFVVRGGRTIATINASTGSERPFAERLPGGRVATGPAVTWDGRFRVNREIGTGWRQSDLGLLWRPKYFNAGIAVHGSTSIPAFPASHGCVRVSTAAMDWIWAANVMPIGTPVWVYSA